MNKQMKFTGIVRSLPQQDAPDGTCQEIINMRHRHGAWRPIGNKTALYGNSFTYLGNPITFRDIYLHDIEGGIIAGKPNWIGYVDGALYLINPATSICTLIENLLAETVGVSVTVSFLKRTMIVTTADGLLVYLWNDGKYGKIGNLPVPNVDMYCTPYDNPTILSHYGIHASVESETAHSPEAVLGNYFASVNQQSANEGRLYGSIMYMVAYKLFDGSFVMHSLPRYLEIANGGVLHQHNPDGSGWDNADWRWFLPMATVSGILVSGLYPAFKYDSMKDLVDSIVVFATKPTPLYKIDNATVTQKLLQDESGYPGNMNVDVDRLISTWFPLNSPEFEDLAKSEGWYQIIEYPFSDVVGDPIGTITKVADTKNFYMDYATRVSLPTDQFSHHNLVGKMTYVYNDRLHLGNVKTIFGIPNMNWPMVDGYTQYWDQQAVIVAYLSTSLGKVTVVNECQIPRYVSLSDSSEAYFLPAIIGYNDTRATKMEVAILSDGSYKLLTSVSLKKNTAMNFAYYHKTDFSIDPVLRLQNYAPVVATLGTVYAIPSASNNVFDENRLQVSEVQNPMFFPAKNSYQVGTGAIIGMAAGSEPLSAGQFGAYPLQIFTDKGIWTMAVGTGDVLYTHVVPIVGEVANNPSNILSVGGAVVYSTDMGLYMLVGNQPTKISDPVEGDPHTVFTGITEVQKLITDNRFTSALQNALSTEDFLQYLVQSKVGYDHHNKELIVSKPGTGYTYIYSFEKKIWYKLSGSFSLLINSYPFLYGNKDSHIYNISDDNHDGFTPVMIITNALSLELPDVFKKIEHMIGRAVVSTNTGTLSGFYLFATNDLDNYELVSGIQRSGDRLKDFLIQRSAGSCKFYTVVFNGYLSHDSAFSRVEISLISKMANKIR